MLGGDGGGGAVSTGGDELACGVGAKVAGGEEAGDAGAHGEVDDGVATGVEVGEAAEKAAVRGLADEDEEGGHGELARGARLQVAQDEPFYLLVPMMRSTTVFQVKVKRGLARARSWRMRLARSVSRRWMRWTLLA